MTPNDIEILLFCHCMAGVHPRRNAMAVRETLQSFLNSKLIEPSKLEGQEYTTTERGKKLVKMLCETPYPEQRWVDPRERFRESKVNKLLELDFADVERRVFAMMYGNASKQEL